jgi:hypothetical protein
VTDCSDHMGDARGAERVVQRLQGFLLEIDTTVIAGHEGGELRFIAHSIRQKRQVLGVLYLQEG